MHNKNEKLKFENFMFNSFTVTQKIGQQQPLSRTTKPKRLKKFTIPKNFMEKQLLPQLQLFSNHNNKQQQNFHHRQLP